MARDREPPRAAAGFAEYAALGPNRSLRKLAEQWMVGQKSLIARQRQLERWSAVYHWQDRVRAYDLERAETKRIKREELQEEINERQMKLAEEQLTRVLKHITGLIESGNLSGRDAVQYIKVLTDLQRTAVGIPNNITQQESTSQVTIKHDQRLFTQAIVQDATASQLAVDLLDRLAARSDDPGRLRALGEPRTVDAGPSPEPPESKAA